MAAMVLSKALAPGPVPCASPPLPFSTTWKSSNLSLARFTPLLQPPLPTRISPVLASIWPFSKKKDQQALKQELLQAIATLDRGAEASAEDEFRVEKIAESLETLNPIKDTLKSPLLSGKWELLYTTSASILKKQRPKLLRPNGPIFQAINTDNLRAQNLETWPFFNQVTANLVPLTGKKVAVKFDFFKIGGLISIKAPGRAQGELEITFLDEELRISRGDRGNLFVLRMVDPSYRVSA